MKLAPILFIALAFSACKNDTNKQTTDTKQKTNKIEKYNPTSEAEKIAYANGFENWNTVTQLDFTFNVDRGGNNVAKRSWSWKPKSNDVTMTSATDTITYNRATIDSTSMGADQGFINDKFWLLAPYQLVWDEGTTITTEEGVESPLANKPSKKLTITYGSDGGYTPGDAYDFYYGDDYKVTEWAFRKGNAQEPSMITTFEGYVNLEGLRIATEHKSEDESFRLYFTDIKVTK